MMPMLVYAVGCMLGTEVFATHTCWILVVVVTGVLVASYGEVVFVLMGVVFQVASLLSEATRLTLVQLLLQSKGIKLNPISSLYYIAQVCLMCLILPLGLLEANTLFKHNWSLHPGIVLLSAIAAFTLNCAVFLLIGKTSALVMNLAGVFKDVMLIYLSLSIFGSTVTELQALGYSVALCGAFYYNYHRMSILAAKPAKLEAVKPLPEKESLKSASTAGA